MRRGTFISLVLSAITMGCSADPAGEDLSDGGEIPSVDAGGADSAPVKPDGGTTVEDSGVDAPPADKTAPMAIVDLAATTVSHTAIDLTWTAPTDPPGGKAAVYDLRRSKTPIATDADFSAATQLNIPAPQTAGATEKFSVTALDPETTYYFAIKAKDAAGNVGPMSNVASATTKARATVLLSEVAMMNPAGADGVPGFDFIELVVTKAGSLKGVEIRQSGSPQLLHTVADLDVALGDRIVVHLSGLPGPTGFAQEDAAKSKTASTETAAFASAEAYDVYSTGTGLAATDNVISVADGTTVLDAVAYSNRDADAAAASMTAFETAKTNASWIFTTVPADGVNDCETQRDAVAISTSFGTDVAAGTCGRFDTGVGVNKSINRVGTTDTNGKNDWYVAAQSPGAANEPVPPPAVVSATPTSSTTVDIRFNQEMDGATVTTGAFTGSGLTVQNATLTEPSYVTLTTSAQNGPHTIGIDATLKTIYGASVATSVSFCGYEPLGGLVVFNEVNPLIVSDGTGSDLIELKATRAGVIGNFSIRTNPTATSPSGTNQVTFPSGLCVASGDLVVVHIDPQPDIVAETSETVSKDELPAATYTAHYDGAWDIRANDSSTLSSTDAVLTVRDASSAYVDALVYTNADGSSTQTFKDSVAYVQSLGLWLPADCSGAACTDATTPTVQGIAVPLSGVGTSTAGNSLGRSAAASTAASWSAAASSWGN